MRFVRSIAMALAVALAFGAALAKSPHSRKGREDGVIYTFDEPGWETAAYSGDAVIGSLYGYHSALNALSVSGDGSASIGGFADLPDIPVVADRRYTIRAWLNADLAHVGSPVWIGIIPPDFNGTTVIGGFYVQKEAIGSGWQFIELGSFVSAVTNPAAKLGAAISNAFLPGGTNAPVSGRWVVDDIEIEEEAVAMPRGKFDANDAAWNVFKGINGDNFYTNLESRVYTRSETPTTQPDIKKPWGVFTQVDPTTYAYENTAGHRLWRMEGVFYFNDNDESDPVNTSAREKCDKFEDDCWEAFDGDPTLGGACHHCEIVTAQPIYGTEIGYAELHVVVEIEQWIGTGDLRPS